MGHLSSALQQLRAERRAAEVHVEKLKHAILVIESLRFGTIAKSNSTNPNHISGVAAENGTGTTGEMGEMGEGPK